MLCLALLAGWGLDDLAGRRMRAPQRACWASPAALLVLPVLVLAARGELSAGLLGRALEVAWGFDWPSPPPPTRDDLTAIRMALADRVARRSWGWRPAAARRARCAAARPRRRSSSWPSLLVAGDLFKAGMGATPAIATDQATQPSTPGHRVPASARRPNRFVGLERPLGPSPLIPNMACAGRSTTRAATTCRWRSATTRCGGAPCVDGGPHRHPDHAARGSRRARCPRSGC